jgi:hypothetical protein
MGIAKFFWEGEWKKSGNDKGKEKGFHANAFCSTFFDRWNANVLFKEFFCLWYVCMVMSYDLRKGYIDSSELVWRGKVQVNIGQNIWLT